MKQPPVRPDFAEITCELCQAKLAFFADACSVPDGIRCAGMVMIRRAVDLAERRHAR